MTIGITTATEMKDAPDQTYISDFQSDTPQTDIFTQIDLWLENLLGHNDNSAVTTVNDYNITTIDGSTLTANVSDDYLIISSSTTADEYNALNNSTLSETNTTENQSQVYNFSMKYDAISQYMVNGYIEVTDDNGNYYQKVINRDGVVYFENYSGVIYISVPDQNNLYQNRLAEIQNTSVIESPSIGDYDSTNFDNSATGNATVNIQENDNITAINGNNKINITVSGDDSIHTLKIPWSEIEPYIVDGKIVINHWSVDNNGTSYIDCAKPVNVTNDNGYAYLEDMPFSTLTITAYGSADAYIANAYNSTVVVVNTTNNTAVATINVDTTPYGVAVSKDGTRAYVVNFDSNTTSVINTSNNTKFATINVGVQPRGVAISPDGTRAYVANYGGNSVSVINTSNYTAYANISVANGTLGIVVSPDGGTVYTSRSTASAIGVINVSNLTWYANITTGTYPYGLAISSDGSRLYSCNNNNNNVSVINTSNYTAYASINVGTNPFGISLSKDGTRAYTSNYGSNTTSVINTSNYTAYTNITVGSGPRGLSLSSNETRLYVSNFNSNNITVINTSDYSYVTNITGFNHPNGLGIMIRQTDIPSANFTTNMSVVLAPYTVQFNDTSANYSTNWSWDFGDGSTSSDQNPVHTYTGGGVYNVSLNASNAAGYSVYNNTSCITVYVNNSNPVVWSGYNWTLATSGTGIAPYGISNGSIWIDSQNSLHLAVRNISGVWTSAELDSKNKTKYGTYVWNVSSGLFSHDKDVSAVLFTYYNDTEELDIESSYWGRTSGTNLSFTNQPSAAWNYYKTTINDDGNPYELKIDYHPDFVHFYLNRSSSVLSEWNMTNISEIPTTSMYSIMHLWLFNVTHPNDNQTQEIVINSFNYTPYAVTPTITWSNPANITYGTLLSSTQLNADAGIAGAYTYTPTTGVMLPAGNGQTLHVDFTPTDTVNYTSASKDVSINVAKVTPTITWSNPANITTGVALGGTQLNAVASVPGIFSYSPAAGYSFVTGGYYKLNTTFTPTDSTNYTTATANVTIGVVSSGIAPVSDFTTNNTYANRDIQFTDASANSPTNWSWDFGDGNTSTTQNPTHKYTNTGTYNVSLNSSNAYGYNNVTKTITVTTAPVLYSIRIMPKDVNSQDNLKVIIVNSSNISTATQTSLYGKIKPIVENGYGVATLMVIALAAAAIMRYLRWF